MKKSVKIENFKNEVLSSTAYRMVDGTSSANVLKKFSRRVANGTAVRLKRGTYAIGDVSMEYLANALYPNSYMGASTVLSKHSVIPDILATVESMTLGKSAEIFNPLGKFAYRHLKASAYCGFDIREDGTRVSTVEKALVDSFTCSRNTPLTNAGL